MQIRYFNRAIPTMTTNPYPVLLLGLRLSYHPQSAITKSCLRFFLFLPLNRFCSCDSRLSQPSERSDEDSNLVYEKTDSGSKSAGMASDLKEFFPLNSHLNGVQFAPKKSILNVCRGR